MSYENTVPKVWDKPETPKNQTEAALIDDNTVPNIGDNSESPTNQPVETLIHIPDVLRNWPWPRDLNPYFEQCRAESDGWIRSFNVFSPQAQTAFNKCEFSLLACMVWPKLNKGDMASLLFCTVKSTCVNSASDGGRIGCDLMNLFFVFDELSDASDGPQTRHQADCLMDALRNPHKPRPEGEWIGGQIAKEYSPLSFVC